MEQGASGDQLGTKQGRVRSVKASGVTLTDGLNTLGQFCVYSVYSAYVIYTVFLRMAWP